VLVFFFFFFSSRRRHTRSTRDWSSDVCSSDLHLLLTDEAVGGYNTDTKMNPPLRGEADRAALVEGLLDGTIDAIATDHAPHTPEEKRVEFDSAPFGVVGLETALSVLLTRLVRPGLLSLMEVLRRLSTTPAAILGLAGGMLELDAP